MAKDDSTQTDADPRDARIAQLEAELADSASQIDGLTKSLAAAKADAEKANKKLAAAKSAPTGDVVSLGGQSYAVLGTVRANQTFDEVRKGHVEEGRSLVVIDRYE